MKRPKKHKDWVAHVTLPKIIKLGYQDIVISEEDLVEAQGCYQSDPSKIRIKDSMDPREKLNTILHEVLHAIVYTYGIKKDFKDDDEEEKIVNVFGNGLTEALTRNPELMKFINEALS